MLVDEVNAALVQLKHEGPFAQRIALSHSLHSARKMAPRQGCVQAVHPTCIGASSKVNGLLPGLYGGTGIWLCIGPCQAAQPHREQGVVLGAGV